MHVTDCADCNSSSSSVKQPMVLAVDKGVTYFYSSHHSEWRYFVTVVALVSMVDAVRHLCGQCGVLLWRACYPAYCGGSVLMREALSCWTQAAASVLGNCVVWCFVLVSKRCPVFPPTLYFCPAAMVSQKNKIYKN